MWSEAVATSFLDHLGPADLALLVAPGESPGAPAPARVHRLALELGRAGRLEEVLSASRLYDAIFGAGRPGPLLAISPFLAFSVALARAVGDLERASYVEEWLGPGRRAPVFDVAALRDFLADPWRRLFLGELLASYSRVSSGSVLVATRRGWRRQRFSELDPVRLAGLMEVVPEVERPGVLRRLGDLSLFLTGVFPDHVARRGFNLVELGRLSRSGVLGRPGRPDPTVRNGPEAVALLEQLGRRSYRAASDLLPEPRPMNLGPLGELPERFGEARRILGFLAERVLFGRRDLLFGTR